MFQRVAILLAFGLSLLQMHGCSTCTEDAIKECGEGYEKELKDATDAKEQCAAQKTLMECYKDCPCDTKIKDTIEDSKGDGKWKDMTATIKTSSEGNIADCKVTDVCA
jgi:hypothetical protein